MATKAVHVRLTGRVQGVFFRDWTQQTATQLGLSGWIRNVRDGSVEAVFSGPADKVDAMLSKCWEGPPAAHVENQEVSETTPPTGTGFRKAATV